ncbi:MAG: hypothetical protein CMF69_00725 [Magnetovibrio sp.]|nr:hypothetical protein [Magnetovibrio sp.]
MPRRPPPEKLPISSNVGGTESDGVTAIQRLWQRIHWVIFLGTSWVWVASLYRLVTVETVTIDQFFFDAFFFSHGALPPLLLWGGLVGFHFIEWVTTRNFTLFPWER